MAEATPINVQAFEPFQGGRGKRLTVTTVSASVAIPGLSGGVPAPNARVLIVNSSATSVFVVMGDQSVVATTDCLEIMPGSAYTLTPPTAGPGGIWLAAITEASTTKISVISGYGS